MEELIEESKKRRDREDNQSFKRNKNEGKRLSEQGRRDKVNQTIARLKERLPENVQEYAKTKLGILHEVDLELIRLQEENKLLMLHLKKEQELKLLLCGHPVFMPELNQISQTLFEDYNPKELELS
jgi:Helix-loop-helix DNA-binding domain